MALDTVLNPGGEFTIGVGPQQLSALTLAVRSVTLRSMPGSAVVYWGLSDLTAGANRRGYIQATESVTISLPNGRLSDIYLVGVPGDVVLWWGEPA